MPAYNAGTTVRCFYGRTRWNNNDGNSNKHTITSRPRGLTNTLPDLVGSLSLTHYSVSGRNEKLNVLLEKGVSKSNFLVNLRQPNSDGICQRSITIQDSLEPATPVHGIGLSGLQHGGVTMHRLTAGIDHSRPLSSKWSRTAGVRIEQVSPVDDHGHPILEDLFGCPTTFSGHAYDQMFVAKIEMDYADSAAQSFSQFNLRLERGVRLLSGWLNFSRFKVHARQGIKLGSFFVSTSLSGGSVLGDLAPNEAFSIGGVNSVRGYGEGAVGTGRSCLVASSELSFPLVCLLCYTLHSACFMNDFVHVLDFCIRTEGWYTCLVQGMNTRIQCVLGPEDACE